MIDKIIQVAMEVEKGDPIDYADIPVDEDSLFFIAATKVLEIYDSIDPSDRDLVTLASMTKLVVENTVLQLRLSKMEFR